jgi:hypothetical protein
MQIQVTQNKLNLYGDPLLERVDKVLILYTFLFKLINMNSMATNYYSFFFTLYINIIYYFSFIYINYY